MCYNPTVIVVYRSPKYEKKIVKFYKDFPYENYGKFFNEHYKKLELISWKDKETGDFIKDYAWCIDITFVPCGNCIGCSLDHSKNWANRLKLENKYHDVGFFITLTYDDDHLPKSHNLVKEDLQKFLKAMKNFYYNNFGVCPKFFAVGEYGGKSGRPHYHLLYWADLRINSFKMDLVGSSELGNKLFSSELVSKFWQNGFNTVAEISDKTIAYVCRYSLKKQSRSRDEKKELRLMHFQSEFLLCSKGLGDQYYIDNFDKILNNDLKIYENSSSFVTTRRFKEIAKKLGREEELDLIIKKRNDELYHQSLNTFSLLENDETYNEYLKKCCENKKKKLKYLKRSN